MCRRAPWRAARGRRGKPCARAAGPLPRLGGSHGAVPRQRRGAPSSARAARCGPLGDGAPSRPWGRAGKGSGQQCVPPGPSRRAWWDRVGHRQQINQRDRLVAVGARTARAEAPGEDAAVSAALLAQQARLAGGALVDRRHARARGGQRRPWRGMAPTPGRLAAGGRAIALAADHLERPLADGAGHRRGVVTRRVLKHGPAPAVVAPPRRRASGL